jgi:hypothetical protein
MFSLIITIISIALVAALAVASVYYGGSAFSQGTAKASASTLVAQAQQIAAANTLYANDHAGTFTNDVGVLLSEGYLSAIPAVNSDLAHDDEVEGLAEWAVSLSNEVTLDLNDNAGEVAKQVNKSIGGGEVVPGAKPDTQYGAYVDGTDLQFFYKG